MPRSTANFISYDLRPTKQCERRILLDILKIAGDAGLEIPNYRYVGMGANRFYDFLLVHKYLAVKKMISLEHDPNMYERARFNNPYHFIEVLNTNTTSFLSNDEFNCQSICWFDYDGGIGPHIIRDILALGTKLKLGDFAFVTTFGGPGRALDKLNASNRMQWFQDALGDFSGEVLIEDVETANFPIAVHKVLYAAFKNAFSARSDGIFVPLLQVEYADSKTMVTVGGALLEREKVRSIKAKVKNALPFLPLNTPCLYEIKTLHLTEKERVLFDRAVTSPKRRRREKIQLKKLGFKMAEVEAYEDLLRYLPRYVETMV